jgi:DNA-binding transcriptional MocR family regulator
MKISLDSQSGTSLTAQIVAQIAELIGSGQLGVGAKLPSIRGLASEQQISRFTVLEAYDRLTSVGLIHPRHGSGYYVSNQLDTAERQMGALDLHNAMPESWQILQQFECGEEALNLSIGFIPEIWRDVEGIAHAIRLASRTDSRSLIDYATPQGDMDLRRRIRQRLCALGVAADTSNVMVTDSASEALDLVIRLMLRPGDTVFVEDPGYFNLFGLLKMQGVRLIGVPRLPSGPDIDAAEALLREHRPKIFFINSVLQNPTGSNIAPHVAFRLLQLAQEHDFVIVEDDVFADFQPIPSQRLASLDKLARVIYIGGFSKSLSSSLRLGYLAATHERIKQLVDVKALTKLGGIRFNERVTAALLERGTYRKHLERLHRRVNDALSIALQLLQEAGWEVFGEPCGGTLVWARVPGIEDSERVVNEASRFGVAVQPGSYYRPNGESTPWMRFNTAHLDDPRAIRFLREMAKLR